MSKAPVDDGEIAHENSSESEPKRSHQQFGTEAELFPHKKQAVEVQLPSSYTELLNFNIPWGNATSFHDVAGQFMERLLDNETVQTTNFDDRNLPLIGMGNMSMGRKVLEDPFGSHSTFGLSMSHPPEDPNFSDVKVNQVRNAENCVPVSLGHAYSTGNNSTMSTGDAYRKADDGVVSMGLSFDRGHDSMIPMAGTFNWVRSNFGSMGQPYNKGCTSEVSVGIAYRENNGSISIGPSVSSNDSVIPSKSQSLTAEDETTIAIGTFNKQNQALRDNFFSKNDNIVAPLSKTSDEGVCNTTSMKNTYGKVDDNNISMGKIDGTSLSVRHSFIKGESNIISFGGLNDDEDNMNPSGRLICSYDFLKGQPSVQRFEELDDKDIFESGSDLLVSGVQATDPGGTLYKRKDEQKATNKPLPNNFPSNVRTLLSTGMLDGIPVKYAAWSQEKKLRGVIKGSAYLCGCQSCTFSKAINAYEFERHAGCKTKHPNNHIYFENGKTVYGIVQELRRTPQSLLFDVIQTITGSPINQKSFRAWKESFLTATHELHRIYGKEEGKTVS